MKVNSKLLCFSIFGFAIACILLFHIVLSNRRSSPLHHENKCLSIEDMIVKGVSMEDECLIEYVRKQRTGAPSNYPYSLRDTVFQNVSNSFDSYMTDSLSPWLEALLAVEVFVPKRGPRKFVECGALDGAVFTTTLHLERFLNWSGVLVEADPVYYARLRERKRRAYTVNACASQTTKPFKTMFRHAKEWGLINETTHYLHVYNPSVGFVVQAGHRNEEMANVQDSYDVEVLCVPIYTILSALEMTTIDLFILDVEGYEFDVLRTIPFNKVDISVMVVEMNGEKMDRDENIQFMKSSGFAFHGYYSGFAHPLDGIFVKEHLYKPEELNLLGILDIFKIIIGESEVTKNNRVVFELFSYYFSRNLNIDPDVNS